MRSDVVLLPGLHGSTALFDSFVALAPPWARCRPIALPTGGEQSFAAIAEALEPDLKALEGFVLIAESFSGPIGARLAAKLGQKVALLVLCNPLVLAPIGLPTGLVASLVASRWTPAWAAATALTGGDRVLARHALREVRSLQRKTLEGRLATAFSATSADLTPFLVAPVLGVLGSRDRLVSPAHARALLKGVPFSSTAEIDAPHLVAQTKPAEVWLAISEEFESAA